VGQAIGEQFLPWSAQSLSIASGKGVEQRSLTRCDARNSDDPEQVRMGPSVVGLAQCDDARGEGVGGQREVNE